MPLTAYIDSDNLVTVNELTDSVDDSFVNSGTVTAKLTSDAAGTTTLSGSSITLTYVTGSDGKYQGAMPSTVTLVDGTTYYLFVTASTGSKNITARVVVRGGYYEGCDC